jgi:hypothetical protein
MTSVKASPLVMGVRGGPPNPIRTAHIGNGTPIASPRSGTPPTTGKTLRYNIVCVACCFSVRCVCIRMF